MLHAPPGAPRHPGCQAAFAARTLHRQTAPASEWDAAICAGWPATSIMISSTPRSSTDPGISISNGPHAPRSPPKRAAASRSLTLPESNSVCNPNRRMSPYRRSPWNDCERIRLCGSCDRPPESRRTDLTGTCPPDGEHGGCGGIPANTRLSRSRRLHQNSRVQLQRSVLLIWRLAYAIAPRYARRH